MEKSSLNLRIEDLSRILDTLKAGIIITDRDGTVLWGNQYYSELAKFNIEEYYGRNVREISGRENIRLPGNRKLFDIALETGKNIYEVVKYNTEDYVITALTPVRRPNGEIDFYLYTLTNYSETVRVQNELSLSHARASALEEHLQDLLFKKLLGKDVVVKNREMQRIFQMGTRLSMVPASVVILGESGVGKDVLAKFIHSSGRRKGHPFIHVNLGAIPKELFESQLFGYAPGAFTGAARSGKMGLIQLADKGTLFLDEVGELPLDIQSKLLQVVQDKAVRSVGSTEVAPVDVRIISATNRNLAEMVREGTFRLDLYYRLNVVEINIPPLRERRDDIPMLAAHFLQEFNSRYAQQKELSAEAIEAFRTYDWPGNIRELRHVIESLVVIGQGQVITAAHLPGEFRQDTAKKICRNRLREGVGLKQAVADVERELILEALSRSATASEAAAHLGLEPSTLAKKRKKYRI